MGDSALLESGSKVGERFVLGDTWSLAAARNSIVAGYVHPKDSKSLPNTGRMAALVAVHGVPAHETGKPGDAQLLHAVAMQLARHVVAAQPSFISTQSVPPDVVTRER